MAISTYEKLEKQNPSFFTFVGNINTQIGNEHLNSYLNTLLFTDEKEAAKELKPGLYNTFIINLAKNYLGNIERDGLLITDKDNDTYPLLYVQAYYGFRRDVRVINSTLLGYPRYIHHMRTPFLDAAALTFSIDDTSYTKDKTNLVMVDDTGEEENLSQILERINSIKASKLNSLERFSIPTDRFKIIANNGDELNMVFNKAYLFRSDIALLDIINATAFKRPIYFSVSVPTHSYNFAEPYCEKEGLVIKMYSHKIDNKTILTSAITTLLRCTNGLVKTN